MENKAMRHSLLEEGYVVIQNILDHEIISRLIDITDIMLEKEAKDELKKQRTTGSMIDVWQEPELSDLIAFPRAIEVIRSLDLGRITWRSGYVISKPARSPGLFWHQDWMFWNDQSSFSIIPPQLFFMYYLTDTLPTNGCLRVIPGIASTPPSSTSAPWGGAHGQGEAVLSARPPHV